MNKYSWSSKIKKSYIYILLAIIYIPLFVIIVLSFSAPSDKGNITNGFAWNGFNNFIDLFQNNEFLNGLVNTLIIAGISVPISIILATITVFGIWNSSRFFEKTAMFNARVSLINPEIITGVSLLLLFSSTWIAIGLNLGLFTIVLSHISFCTPYALIAIYPRMNKMKKSLIHASNDLGYSTFKTFFKVVIPYLLPSILGAAAIIFSLSFDDFIITNLVRGRVNTVSTEIYLMAKGIKSWAVALGALLIVGFLIFIIIRAIFTIKKNKEKENNKLINVYKEKKEKIKNEVKNVKKI